MPVCRQTRAARTENSAIWLPSASAGDEPSPAGLIFVPVLLWLEAKYQLEKVVHGGPRWAQVKHRLQIMSRSDSCSWVRVRSNSAPLTMPTSFASQPCCRAAFDRAPTPENSSKSASWCPTGRGVKNFPALELSRGLLLAAWRRARLRGGVRWWHVWDGLWSPWSGRTRHHRDIIRQIAALVYIWRQVPRHTALPKTWANLARPPPKCSKAPLRELIVAGRPNQAQECKFKQVRVASWTARAES